MLVLMYIHSVYKAASTRAIFRSVLHARFVFLNDVKEGIRYICSCFVLSHNISPTSSKRPQNVRNSVLLP